MASEDSDGEDFGQRAPPLSVIIKGILERYPDGQIFKEVIQNADDAGAKTVRFYVDCRQHGTDPDRLWHRKLAPFQGPALLVHNDARFEDDDWDGIQNLQLSSKAKDPFKVGKFGIGFNSVYHITDQPTVISGETIAYLEPQERVWRGQSGRKFSLAKSNAQMKLDALAPFENISGFQRGMLAYPHTLFRFPLRTTPTEDLSCSTYTVEKLRSLLSALRKEAKFLLLFLRSVHTIEVFEISQNGAKNLSFRVSIDEQAYIVQKRSTFMRGLRSQHQRQRYGISRHIGFTANFHVSIVDKNPCDNQTGISHWLVANQVGSTKAKVCEAATQQRVFPWVGTALELQDDPRTKVSPGGRIFCIIPMPDMTSSGLPVHVNGTFGVNDDRRTLKWPDRERRNDPTANWNVTLATELLPPCYETLLLTAKAILPAKRFYEAWPNVSAIPQQWKGLLAPLFKSLFSQSVVRTEALSEWITPEQAVFIPNATQLVSIVHSTLSECGVKLVELPTHIWAALAHIGKGVKEVSPQLARSHFRSRPDTYSGSDQTSKTLLLKYCLSDKQYRDLNGVVLLPLANGTFIAFQSRSLYCSSVYLCSSECPRYLLPNVDASLVDVSSDSELQRSLGEVADQLQTQLQRLTVADVANLLSKAMPAEWQGRQVVAMPHARFPKDWFSTFWEWANRHSSLKHFENSLTVPVLQTGQPNASSQFRVARLNNRQAILLVPSYTYLDPSLLSALDKLQVMCCTQSDFPYLRHHQLIARLKSFDPNGVLDTIMTVFPNASALSRVIFQPREAECLCELLSKTPYSSTQDKQAVLSNLAIFSTTSGTLCSVSHAASSSMLRKALLEPQNSSISMKHLPSNIILFSNGNQNQNMLLQQRCSGVEMPSDLSLLLDHIFPLITNGQITSDALMEEVLTMFQALKARDYYNRLTSTVQDLPFLNGRQRKCPRELFDPSPHHEISKLYQGEARFPTAPFNSYNHLQVLRQCGLRTTVTTQEVVGVIVEIATTGQRVSDVKILRAKSVLNYIVKNMLGQLHTHCRLTFEGSRQVFHTFSQALNYLAQHFSWLPIAQCPNNYPSCLQWKGAGYESCFTSLNGSTLALTAEQSKILPYIAGSQVFVVDPPLHPDLLNVFTNNASLPSHVVEHFKQVIGHQNDIPPAMLERMVLYTYSYLNTVGSALNLASTSFPPWIWIKRDSKFVKPSEIALKQDSNFRQNLEPYIYILPDNLSPYAPLFKRFGAKDVLSQAQIVSVLEKIAASESSQATDWATVMSILNWLTNDGTQDCPLDSDAIFVPVDSDNETLKLVRADNTVYTDNEFLKEFTESSDSEESYTFVHERIHPKMAQHLGIQPLDEFLDITEDTFEDSGQSEPLTTRLKNILRDYKDGLTIIKELLQNADDAEATEVNICYDARTHDIPKRSLFFRGMSECHGPALLVHNNAVFSKDDFQNITKLAGATKENKALKIGKFGVGFCSVYHITDIPSFISGDRLVIFDPTISCLKKEIKNPARPGKRVKFMTRVIASSKQLAPYIGLFGFSPQQPYNGTLFRLPFRTQHSELSSTLYSEGTVKKLIDDIQNSSSKLMLFLQNVRRITFQQIDESSLTPSILLDIRKEMVPLPLHLKNAVIQKSSCTANISGSKSLSFEYYLVATNSQLINSKLATASVACLLQEVQAHSSTYTVQTTEGEIFCFLPLSQETRLPVHVSANFAVNNNRRGIWTSDDAASKTNAEVKWNLSLMTNVIPKAYHTLLSSLQSMCVNDSLRDYSFYSLWPTTVSLRQHNPWDHFVQSLYKLISTDKLFYSHSTKQWLTLLQSKFLRPGILCQSQGVLPCVQSTVNQLNIPIVDLPPSHQVDLNVSNQTITEEAFIKLFFENLSSSGVFERRDRNEVICHMLETYAAEYDNGTDRCYSLDFYLQSYACIPCSPDGSVLKQPSEVVASDAKFCKLYDPEEHMFPAEELSTRHLVYGALQTLGMVWKTIPWKMIIERAKTVAKLFEGDKEKALRRTKLILECIEHYTNYDKLSQGKKTELIAVNFLPVVQKPSECFLPWFGENCQLLSANRLMKTSGFLSTDNARIAGSQVAFVCENGPKQGGCSYIHDKTRELLTIRTSPSPEEVIKHFKKLVTFFEQNEISEALIKATEATCRQIYGFLNDQLYSDGEKAAAPEWIQELRSIRCLWSERQFIKVKMVAKLWKHNGPYLFPIPDILSTRRQLSSALQIKDNFTLVDFQEALQKMRDQFGDKPIDDACQQLFREIQSELQKLFPVKTEETAEPTDPVRIVLPDQAYVLHWLTDLAYNDAPWLPQEDAKYKYVHDNIPRNLAKQLGVKAVRSRLLGKYIGTEFGQREELTRRIQNIIRDYPFDITVLKELLQNADDAKASKMCVILDKRTHGTNSVLSEKWQELQGPALLVWNDSTFSEKDLKGIQDLGLGSKRSEAESIGQYGIGFNVVYYLTDCPSFVTGGETMCIMDPHCRYVGGANEMHPGRRLDHLKEGFWEDFPDMKSAYLQDGLDNCPKELLGGSLFRFPLRHTHELLIASELIGDEPRATKVLDSQTMHDKLTEWAPKMKQAMFFLNHVKELRFYVIEKYKKTMTTEHHFQTHIDKTARESCNELQAKLSAFKKERGSNPCVVRYRLTLTEFNHKDSTKVKKDEEQWLIQQGVGDIQNKERRWAYVDQVKPRHGIAAPFHHTRDVCGQVFCFLPLPIKCKLPVHINGHFILNSTRRELWKSSDPNDEDDKTKWNKYLFEAIASSYENFLINIQPFYLTQRPYDSYDKADSAIRQYYKLFPNISDMQSPKATTAPTSQPSASRMSGSVSASQSGFIRSHQIAAIRSRGIGSHQTVRSAVPTSTYRSVGLTTSAPVPIADTSSKALEGPWLEIAISVYKNLHAHNAKVLVVIGKSFTVEVHPLTNKNEPSKQVYFWSTRLDHYEEDIKVVRPILKKIGMLIAQAPWMICRSFSKVEVNLPYTKPETVFTYYTRFSGQASPSGFPCAIETSKFGSVEVFTKFTKYLLKPSEESSKIMVYPESPFSHPLLLTADSQLRCFDDSHKVIRSEYSKLFPRSLNKFLHPCLLGIQYTAKYFVECVCDDDTGKCRIDNHQDLIDEILNKNLPQTLYADRVNSADLYISQLTELWKCFSDDSTFNAHLSYILEHWALLLSTDQQLFSLSSTIHPVSLLDSQSFRDVFEVLMRLKMPFLDMAIVTAKVACPTLSDYKCVLAILYHMNCETPIALNEAEVTTLVTYLQNINFKNDKDCLLYVTSLPLFKSIDGSFTSVHGKTAYQWNFKAIHNGHSKWLMQHDNVVFVNPLGIWKGLGTLQELGIIAVSAEEIYLKFIFRRFSNMNCRERYRHLEHIRDKLFPINQFRMNDPNEDVEAAVTFVEALKNLPCLGEDGELKSLRRVADFASHKVNILTTFKHHFVFLPQYFTANKEQCDKWMEFFLAIGLRKSITRTEFKEYCRETSKGDHCDPAKASYVLLRYLFSQQAEDDGWKKDENFLDEVSNIPFVCTACLPNLSWIKPVANPSNTIQHGRNIIQMTQLNGAGVNEKRLLLWTVSPIVSLPHGGFYPSPEDKCLMDHLHVVTQPSKEDVLQNVANVCSSRFANFKHFDKYSKDCETPEHATGVIDVLLANFKFLWANYQKKITSTELSTLANLPCIPVHNTFEHQYSQPAHIVLVKPCSVLTSESRFHPFLNKMPNELFPVAEMLSKIGVHSILQLSHIQVALQTAFESSDDQQLTPNTLECVTRLLNELFHLLKNDVTDNERVRALSPLYLTNTEQKLVSTKFLLYTGPGEHIDLLKLDETGLSVFYVPWLYFRVFNEHEFCARLPEQLKLKSIYECCDCIVSPECKVVENCKLAEHFENIFSLPILLRAITKVLQHCSGDQYTSEIEEELISDIKFVTVENLLLEISLKETKKSIGKLQRECYYEPQSLTFYVNSEIDEVTKVHAFVELAQVIISTIKAKIGVISDTNIKEIISLVLHATEPKEISKALALYDITLEPRTDDFNPRLKLELGKTVPEQWHHRLDQDIDNVFHSMEWVGYEKSNGSIIFAKVAHLVITEDGNRSVFVRKYKIYISEDDEEGLEVSVLDLYKFLRGLKKSKELTLDPETSELVPYEGESDANRLRDEMEATDIKAIKIKLCKDLKEIWKLPEPQRNKAIKRLYLKWHPDKNLDNPKLAEEIFKFLKTQIGRLERNLDPDLEASSEPRYNPWTWNFRTWDRTAYQQAGSFANEDHFNQRSASGDNWSSSSTSSPFDNASPTKKPEEGKHWLRQAEVDYRGLLNTLEKAITSDATLSGLVCFLAHQVAEKALKGGMYAECGDTNLKSHNLSPLVYALQHEQPGYTQGLATHAIPLENYYLDPRYPNRWSPHSTPADMYSVEQAAKAKTHAEAILTAIRHLPNMQ